MPILTVSPFNTGGNDAFQTIYRGPVGNWTTIRNATTGTGVYTTGNTNPAIRIAAIAGARGTSYYINRIWAWYDCAGAGLPSGATINSVDLTVATTVSPSSFPIGDIMVVEGSAFGNNSNATATTSEFGNLNFSQNYLNSSGTWNNINGNNNYTLNSTAANYIAANGLLGICIIDFNYDFQDIDPFGGISFDSYNTIDFGNVSKSSLTINYTAAGYGNEVNGIAAASIGEVNGISSSNINQVNGL